MRKRILTAVALAFPLTACGSAARSPDLSALRAQVMEAERAFARTLADRDRASFTSYLSEEAVFFEGETPTSGKEAIVAQWTPFFDGPAAPFAWEPDRVEVLASGTLALTTGPVYDPAGNVVGRFNSVWRQEAPGQWRVVFDKGSPVCPAPPAASPGG